MLNKYFVGKLGKSVHSDFKTLQRSDEYWYSNLMSEFVRISVHSSEIRVMHFFIGGF